MRVLKSPCPFDQFIGEFRKGFLEEFGVLFVSFSFSFWRCFDRSDGVFDALILEVVLVHFELGSYVDSLQLLFVVVDSNAEEAGVLLAGNFETLVLDFLPIRWFFCQGGFSAVA